MSKQDRVDLVNKIVRVIGDNGRNFFKYKDRYAKMEIGSRGHIYWIDEYTEARIYTHCEWSDWRGFSNGGTLKDVVKELRDFVRTGERVKVNIFGPYPDWYCNGDLWGYGDDMKNVREAASGLGII